MSKKSTTDDFVELTPLEAMHDTVKGLYDIGLTDAETMRKFNVLCLPEVKQFTPRQIKKVRLREKVSQSVFAKYLNTSLSTIKHWEQGEKRPRGAAMKLLNLVHDKGLKILV
jgi:putative transcriptional regulator